MFKNPVKIFVLFCLCLLIVLLVASGHSPDARELNLDAGEENIRILGEDEYEALGYHAATGDINGDGYRDIIIGASNADTTGGYLAGKVYVIYGGVEFPTTIDLNSESADITICGANDFDYTGISIASGNVNGDSYDDIIIGAPSNIFGEPTTAGITYVIFGSDNLSSSIDLSSESADITIYGDYIGECLGTSIASGDINYDGYSDILIGAPSNPFSPFTPGKMYVILGSYFSPPVTIDLSSESADMTISGDGENSGFGIGVGSSDINGDSFDDIIVGAPYSDPSGGTNAGETYVIFGSTSPPSTIDLSSESADMTISGDDAGDCMGVKVASGNINGDSYNDIMIGAPSYPLNPTIAGKSYVIFGSNNPSSAIDLNSESADVTVLGADDDDGLGNVATGNINNDDYDDMIIGAYFADTTGGSNAGETYIIYGSDSLPSTIDLSSESANITIYGDDAEDRSGSGLGCGDINGDGYDDVLIGAYLADPGGRDAAGETYAIFGNALPIDCDFSDTDISDWEIIGKGTAKVKNNHLVLSDAQNWVRIFPPGSMSHKADIKVKMKRNLGESDYVKSSVFFGFKDTDNYWRLLMYIGPVGSGISRWQLAHRVDGVTVQIKSKHEPIYRNRYYSVEIEVRGDQIRVVVNGVEKINLIPAEKPNWGKIGLSIRGPGKGHFDDLLIY